jgi:hypothetical protein
MRHLNGQAAQRQQVQGFDQAEGIEMQRPLTLGLSLDLSTVV